MSVGTIQKLDALFVAVQRGANDDRNRVASSHYKLSTGRIVVGDDATNIGMDKRQRQQHTVTK
jgi:hypothetical protein